MGNWFVILSTLLYVGAAIAYLVEGRYGLAWMYAGYALANGGVLAIGYKFLS
jgi:hypothetical protein